jgi:hypothetical protein
MQLGQYVPEIVLQGLLTGVDNVRTDVYLSPKFVDIARQHIAKLLAKYGDVEDLIKEDAFSAGMQQNPAVGGVSRSTFIGSPPMPGTTAPTASRPTGFIGSQAPNTTGAAPKSGFIGSPQVNPAVMGKTMMPTKAEPADFKKLMADLLVGSLNRAKTENNINLDMLTRLAVIKMLRTQMTGQFNQILEKSRTKLKTYDGPRAINPHKGIEMREKFSQFQINKKVVLRKAGQDIFATMREIEKETLSKMRRSLFGEAEGTSYDLLLNRLLFTEDGKDDYLNAEQYVMLGNYERDADRFQRMQEFAAAFIKSLGLLPANQADEDKQIDAMLSVTENSHELFAGGTPDETTPKGKAQKTLLEGWVESLEKEALMDYVIASYEAVPLLAQYSPLINPQQLKNSLINKTERERVKALLEERGKISPDGINNAVKKIEGMKSGDRAKIAGRYFGDFLRYHRDLRRFEAVLLAMDGVNVIGSSNEKLRELSAINNTLYEFLLTEEQKPSDASVIDHVILKADIRDSTTLTKTLFERGLNPASYFSLNFFDPVNKLLPKYDATKVFIEGDALILALFEREGEQGFGVGKTCMLAKEMVQLVRGYNEQSQKSGLPTLELGLGICFQESAPMYLMDGAHRIMISKALNESDRLSGCSKGARKYLAAGQSKNLFNVYNFQTVEDADTGGIPDEFLVRYNIGGIHINALAFQKLRKEIALKEHLVELPTIWSKEQVRLFTGVVPVGQGIFHKIIVREGLTAFVDLKDFSLKRWTDKKYYEVCVNEALYKHMEKEFPVV